MKEVTKMSRLTGQLEKMFRVFNAELFDNVLETPVITVTPSARSYAHYTPFNAWQSKEEGKREVNIASGTLNRPLELVSSSLLHEMVHMYNDLILCIKDTSRGGTFHNKQFKLEAEKHALICMQTEKYGWSYTEPSDRLLELLLDHDELREIEMCRVSPDYAAVNIGTHTNSGSSIITVGKASKSNSRKWLCPCCGDSVRSTKTVNIICGNCMKTMLEV